MQMRQNRGILLQLLTPHHLLYSPKTSPTSSPCAVDVQQPKRGLVFVRVWEREGRRVFCFSGMPFQCTIVGDEKYVHICCHWIRRTYLSSMQFSLQCCCGGEVPSFFVNGVEGHAIQVGAASFCV